MILEEKKAMAAHLLATEIDWYEDDKGHLECPGEHLHTKPTKKDHTVLYMDGVPTLYCWHSSCADKIEEANYVLRHNLCDPQSAKEKAAAKSRSEHFTRAQADAKYILQRKDWVLREFDWPTLFNVSFDPTEAFLRWLQLFEPGALLWVGDLWDTGPVKGTAAFRTAEKLCAKEHIPNLYSKRYTTTSTYKPGTIDRKDIQVLSSPYVVLEFDHLHEEAEENKRQGAAFIKWASRELELVAVIDSGNKSLHGWFKRDHRFTPEVQAKYEALGADAKSMRPAQPVRVPGARRENGRVQSLLWID